MTWLVETALVNGVLVLPLALLAWLVSHRGRRPALAHALWVLVLLKLLTPPLVRLPIQVQMAVADTELSVRTGIEALVTGPLENSTPIRPPATSGAIGAGPTHAQPSLVANQVRMAPSTTGSAETSTTGVAATPIAGRTTWPSTRSWWLATIGVWLAGCVAWVVMNLTWVRRFCRRLADARPADQETLDRGAELAAGMGLSACPPIVVLNHSISPLLWACGRQTRIVLPALLLERLGPAERDSLLVHELAHYRRRDHWVRVLELLVTGLYWWHPVVWLARRELERTEEECCDAWVIGQFPESPRSYAEAILATIDFISERRVALPPAASGVADVPALERRLRQIMCERLPKSLSNGTRWCLVGLALVLPMQPVLTAVPAVQAALAPADRPVIRLPAAAETNVVAADSRAEQLARVVEPGPLPPDPRLLKSVIYPPVKSQYASAVSPNGRYQITSEAGVHALLEDLQSGRRIDLSGASIRVAAFLPDGEYFVTGSTQGEVRKWKAQDGVAISALGFHQAAVQGVDVSPDGRFAVSGGADGRVYLWDLDSEGGEGLLLDDARFVSAVRFSADGRGVAVATGDPIGRTRPQIFVFDLATRESAQRLTPDRAVGALRFDTVDRVLSVDWSGATTEWDVATGSALGRGSVPKEAVSEAAFSPNNTALSVVTPALPAPPIEDGSFAIRTP
jgi:beta-lactamase regulating signal transducer with metallopeptidase domain